MDNIEALNKVARTGPTQAGTHWATAQGSIGSGTMRGQIGTPSAEVQLTDAQQKFIVNNIVRTSTFLNDIRRVNMTRSRMEFPRFSLGNRVMRAAAAGGHPESTAGTEIAPDFGSLILTSSKLVANWTITEEFLEDNPEGAGFEDLMMQEMIAAATNDLEDLAMNGDESLTGDVLYRANNGFLKLATAASNTKKVDFAGADFTTDVFDRMIRALPAKYMKNVRDLRFYVPRGIYMDYVQSWAARNGDNADKYLSDLTSEVTFGGIPVRMVTTMPETGNENGGGNESSIILTNPNNLVWGVERDMRFRKTNDGKDAIQKDERYYALYIRCDFAIQEGEALVIGTEITPRVA